MFDLVLACASLDGALGMLLAHVHGLPMVEGADIVKRIPHVGRQGYLAGQGTIPPSVGYKLMMNTIKPHGIGIASDVANAKPPSRGSNGPNSRLNARKRWWPKASNGPAGFGVWSRPPNENDSPK